ncbi:MAG: polymer-forming cytoskeletal protein [Burkholderiales bacterium]|nr:polymer-forming cytoskeletal protein [Burkholderiales bacterium]
MFGARQTKPNGRIDTLIGAGSRVEGDVHFVGGLRIDGAVKGNVVADDAGTVVLSEHASVEGEIRVAHAVINGKVIGPIYGAETVELQPKADICGDVHYKTLEVQIGAIVQGRLAHAGEQRDADKIVSLRLGAAD